MGNLATLLHCFSLPFKRKMSQNESTVSDKETTADKEATTDNDSVYVEGDARDSGVLDLFVSTSRYRKPKAYCNI